MAFGHGRALEAYLGTLKILIGLAFSFTDLASRVPATTDLFWQYPRSIIAAPFFIVGFIQLVGVTLNIKGYECSWIIRAVGAGLAIAMWIGMLVKTSLLNELSVMVPLATVSLPFSAFLFWKAINRLPVPGAPGLR